jgi:peptidoglycan hydrolase CwlO-like protein
MKYALSLLFVALLTTISHAQQAVFDASNYQINLTSYNQTMANWATQIQNVDTQIQQFNTQIQQYQQQIQQLTNVQTYLGSALQVVNNVAQLKSDLQTTQQSLSLTNLTSNLDGLSSLPNTFNGMYQSISTISPGGNTVNYTAQLYKPVQAVENAYQNLITTQQKDSTLLEAIKQDISATQDAINSAPDQATVMKLQAKLQGDNAEVTVILGDLNQAVQQIQAQKTLNDSEKDKQATADAEQYQADLKTAYPQDSSTPMTP